MKKLLFIIIALPVFAFGQSADQNYVKTTIYRGPASSNPAHSVTYYDGLGRPIQQIVHNQSGTGEDIVTHIEYDGFGRQAKEYLPIINGQTLNYHNVDAGIILLYYSTPALPTIEATTNPYSEKLFENSPLNRVLKQAAPGNPWAMGQGHEVRFDYQTNIVGEVRLFKAITTFDSYSKLYAPNFSDEYNYDKNQLYKTVTKDENWTSGNNNTTEEFKDTEGHIVLKRTYNQGTAHDTYYVYDEYGNLTYVLPPMVNTNTGLNQSILDDLCYQYKYDSRNRLAEKKLPGKQWEYIVYNSQDKPVATGPAMNPFGGPEEGWLVTKYDAFGRVIYTGWIVADHFDEKRRSFQDEMDNAGANWAEQFDSNSFITIDNFVVNYTNNVYPNDITILTVNYYDSYSYKYAPAYLPLIVETQEVLTDVKGLPTGNWVRVLETPGIAIGDLTYTLYDQKARPIRNHTTNYLGGFTQADTKLDFMGKAIHTSTTHKRVDSSDLLTVRDEYLYTAEDRVSQHAHKINNSATENITANTYDALGLLIRKNVGGMPDTPLQKVDLKYNIRGWLKQINDVGNLTQGSDPKDLFAFKINYNESITNNVGGTIVPLYNGNIAETNWRSSTDNVLRRYGYTYDNLNRLTNAVYQKPNNAVPVTNMYNELMDYDKNGNILSLKRNGDYDSDIYGAVQIDDQHYYYDHDKKNQLMKVSDITNSPKGFKDDSTGYNDTTDDYAYDDNGNMISDENKGITSIVYNHLNLPIQINFGTANKIEYLYDATGQKQRKVVTEGTDISSTDYLDGFQYMNDKLSFFPHAEGYVNATFCAECQTGHQTVFNYVYQYKDHLGNIRLSYGLNHQGEGGMVKILEENHYYPFGLKHSKYNTGQNKYDINEEDPEQVILKTVPAGEQLLNKYKYNGKEYQDELGLNMYDYGARNYDPALGRWFGLDYLSEKHFNFSPYVYTANNPVLFVDYDGNDYGVEVNKANQTITVKATYLVSSKNEKAFNKNGKDAYNNKSGQMVFVPGGVSALKNGNSTAYKINFDLKTQVSDGPQGANSVIKNNDTTGTLNAFDSQSFPYYGMKSDNGVTTNDQVTVRDNRVGSDTTTHEVGHSLGAAHADDGDGGSLPIQGAKVDTDLVAEILAGAGIGGNNIQRNADGGAHPAAGDATMLNGSTNQGLETGEVITLRKYNRIMNRLAKIALREGKRSKKDHSQE
jgi:RHS repeat-associated protein